MGEGVQKPFLGCVRFYRRSVKVKVSSKFEKVIKLTPAFIISTYKDPSGDNCQGLFPSAWLFRSV